jgi:YHS domain-containing protein
MIRAVLYILVALLLISFLRQVIGLIVRALGELLGSSSGSGSGGSARTPTVGELKRDPVCGTYVATSSSIKATVGGEVFHFCSEACRNKYLSGRS